MFGCLRVEGNPLSDDDLICLIVGAESMLANRAGYLFVTRNDGKGDEEIKLVTDFRKVKLECLSGTRFKAELKGNGRKTNVDFVFAPEDDTETTIPVRPVISENHPALSAHWN